MRISNNANPKTLEVKILKPRGDVETRTVKSFTEIQKIVGGYVEMFTVNGVTFLCNEEASYGTHELNQTMYHMGEYIRGNVVQPLGDIDVLSYE